MNIGELSIQLSMDLARLSQDMAQTKRVVGDAMKGVEQYAGLATKALGLLAGATTVAGFASMISSAIEARAKLYDLGLQSGLTVEQLSSLGKVAKYSDTSLQDIAAASNKLQKALATSNEDSKGAAQALQALGLSFAQIKALSPDQQLLAVAQAMGKFEDGTGKSVAAMLLYGKTGAALLPFLKELEERGLQATKMTTASALAAKQYEDNLVTLKNAGEEWKKQLVSGILPALVNVTEQLVAGRQAYGGWAKAVLDIGWNVDPLKSLNANAAEATRQLVGVQDQISSIKARQSEGGIMARLLGSADGKDLAYLQDQQKLLEQRLAYIRQIQVQTEQAGRGKVNPTDQPKARLDLKAEPEVKKPVVADTYTPFLNALNRKLADMDAELELGRKLTAAEKERVDAMAKLTDGTVRATDAQQARARSLLDLLVQRSREAAADEAELKFQEEARRETAAFIADQARQLAGLQDNSRALRLQAEEYGLNAQQLQALTSARLRATAADLRARQLTDEASPDIARLNRLYRSQADELERIAAAQDRAAARAARDAADPLAGANRAVQQYLDDVARAGDNTQRAVEAATRTLEDGLTSFLAKGRIDVRSFVDTLIAEFIRLLVVKPLLADLLNNGVGSGTGGTGGLLGQFVRLFDSRNVSGGYNGNTTGPVDGFAGNFATGGYIPPGQWGMTGEAGPEPVFGGRTGATVLPNSALAAAPVVQQVVHNHIDARSDLAVVEQIARNATQQGLQQFYAQLRADGRL